MNEYQDAPFVPKIPGAIGMPPPQAPQVPSPLGEYPVEQSVKKLGQLISDLQAAVDKLVDRLDVALTPLSPQAPTAQLGQPPVPARSELASVISNKANSVAGLIKLIQSVTDRVEL